MKSFIKLGLLFSLILGITSPAKADLLLEPVVGFNMNTKLEIDNGDKYSGGMGLGYGGRVGYQNLGLQLGLDYFKSSIDMGDDDLERNVRLSEMAAFVGFKFPLLFRVYAGYIFSASGDTKAGGSKVEFNSGNGTKLGVGFTGLPFVNINLEYRLGKFDDYEVAGVKVNEKVDYSSLLLSLSLPFAL